jgi:hypothetical protein
VQTWWSREGRVSVGDVGGGGQYGTGEGRVGLGDSGSGGGWL